MIILFEDFYATCEPARRGIIATNEKSPRGVVHLKLGNVLAANPGLGVSAGAPSLTLGFSSST
jgi:hypothetical protein